ncbi:MAG: hypothetical protein HYT62_04010 [Candidatus Yanofskybacteria bacterium]|nr:hypothetical protein [Candidatus Yanofskybacteria bacterium]
MTKEKINPHPGVSWLEQEERKQKEGNQWANIKSAKERTTNGLKEAIGVTERKIAEHKANNWDASELEVHLKSLEQRLEAAKKK